MGCCGSKGDDHESEREPLRPNTGYRPPEVTASPQQPAAIPSAVSTPQRETPAPRSSAPSSATRRKREQQHYEKIRDQANEEFIVIAQSAREFTADDLNTEEVQQAIADLNRTPLAATATKLRKLPRTPKNLDVESLLSAPAYTPGEFTTLTEVANDISQAMQSVRLNIRGKQLIAHFSNPVSK